MEGNKKSIDSVYLDSLEYDPELENSIFTFFIDRPRFLILMIFIIGIAGFLGLRALPLESTPEVKIGVVSVITTLPGGSPEVLEDLVTKKIEQEVSKIKWVDTITSSSKNSLSQITVQLKSDADIPTLVRDIKDKVDLVKPKLPSDAKDPIVQEFSFSEQPIWVFTISGPYNGFDLYDFGKVIKDELEKNSLVSEVRISGWDQSEYRVAIDPKKLDSFGLGIEAVNTALKATNIAFPIGNYDIGSYRHTLTVDERFYTVTELRNLTIAKLGTSGIIRLSDVAEVTESPIKRTNISRFSAKGSAAENAVTISVIKKRGGSIVNLVSDGTTAINGMKERKILPSGLRTTTILDQAERIKLDLSHLIRDGLITVAIVILVHFAIIGVLEAMVAGMVVPLVFLITFVVMAVAGQTLNFLSMFALILSLWLLVDDAIVVISAINQYKRTGKFTTRQAALLVLRDFRNVLVSTTLTVVWIFSAMLFMTWVMGKFIFSIPFIITVTLLASLVVALTINPALSVYMDKADSRHHLDSIEKRMKAKMTFLRSKWWKKWVFGIFTLASLAILIPYRLLVIQIRKILPYLNHGFLNLEKIEEAYARAISKLISSRKNARTAILTTIGLFFIALLLPISGIVKSEFFPASDQDSMYVDVEMEPGTRLEETSALTRKIEEKLMKEAEITSFQTTIGSASALSAAGASTNYASISINLVKKEYGRKETSISMADRFRKDFAGIPGGTVIVREMKGGPPAGADFEIKIAGDDFTVLERIAGDVKKRLATIPGTINITTSRKPLPLEFRMSFASDKLALYDVTLPQVASFVKNAVDGTEATKIYRGTDEIVVRTMFQTGSTDSIDKLKDLKLRSNKGQDVYLRDIMKNDLNPSVFSIDRFGQKRIVKVSASAAKGTTGAEILRQYNEKSTDISLPAGYEFILGGANEENAKSVQSLLVAMIFGMLFIIATLVILFDSYKQSALALITIPLSLIGVFVGLALFRQPLSFPGLIGLVALFGIVVRNGIILFDKINLNLEQGIEFKEAIIDAGKTRLEPVALTSLCTVLGMVPLTLSNPTWTSLGLSIIFGLSASTFLTLLILPTLYYSVFEHHHIEKKKKAASIAGLVQSE